MQVQLRFRWAVALLLSWGAFEAPTLDAAGMPALDNYTISVNGSDRSYLYYVSTKANSFNGNAVVFALHATGQTARDFAQQSGWMKVAEDNGFAVVFPEASDGNTWAPNSGGEDDYLKAVFDHVRTHLISRFPGDNVPAIGGNASGVAGGNNPIWAWEPLRYMTGSGGGAVVAQEFVMNHPGLFAALATFDGVAYDGAYAWGEQPAQAYFQHMRGKNLPPSWQQSKKDVPVAVWMFESKKMDATAEAKQLRYWAECNDTSTVPSTLVVAGFKTQIYRNPQHDAQQVRETKLDAVPSAVAMAQTIWSDFFAHIARWTSSPNGDLVSIMTEAEVNRQFEVHSIDVGDGLAPFKYYLKLPSTYVKGQALPLVISAHGANEQAWLFLSKIKMHEVGEKEGFITVYPNGRKNRWESNDPDSPDARFIEMMIAEVIKTYGADPTRIYMQGFSNGNAMTTMMGLTRPRLFAAVSPNNGPGPLPPAVESRVAELKSKSDERVPMLIVYGDVDNPASVDGKIPAGGSINQGIDLLKRYDRISTPDRIERLPSPYTAPYSVLSLGGQLEVDAIDAHYPAGRFQLYKYFSDDGHPLNLLDVLWVLDLPHAYDLREAQLEWSFFKKWRRKPDGELIDVESTMPSHRS